MLTLSWLTATFLIVLGFVGYYVSNGASLTAMIPTAFGVVILLLAVMGRAPGRRRMAMHMAMVVALLGIAGSFGGLVEVVGHGQLAGLRVAAISRALMATALIIYLAAGVRSFITARRQRSLGR